MHVTISGWYAGHSIGSGQYTDRLAAALRAGALPGDRFDVVCPKHRGALAKLYFEQVAFPWLTLRSDLAHVPYWAPPQCPATPTVVTVHDLIPLVLPTHRRRRSVRAYTALVANATRRAAAVLADSEHTAADVRRHLDVDPARIHVIPLGVEARYRPGIDLARIRAVHDLPRRYGLYLGGFDVRKNLMTLLAAWREVYATTGVPLVVAGRLPTPDEPLTPDPRAIARRIRVPGDALRCIGHVSEQDKPALYAGAAVFAYPSRYEGFGLPPLEAMACGTPVVAADATSLPEVVGGAGRLVDPDDVTAWVAPLTAILEDGDLASHLRSTGPQQAAQFTWQQTAARTQSVYQAVLTERNSPSLGNSS